MTEFFIKLSENMMSELLLGGQVKVNFEDRDGNYKLEDLTSMMCKPIDYVDKRERRGFTLFCTATKKQSMYKVRLELTNVKGDLWFTGKIIFPKVPI